MTFLEELFAFVGFDDDDRARLRALHPRLAPQFGDIAARFYAAVLANPGTANGDSTFSNEINELVGSRRRSLFQDQDSKYAFRRSQKAR